MPVDNQVLIIGCLGIQFHEEIIQSNTLILFSCEVNLLFFFNFPLLVNPILENFIYK